MKASVYERYGPPDVLQLKEVEKPTPKEDEVLMKVHAASVTFGDLAAVKGEPFMVRFTLGLREPKYKILGKDVAGQIEAVGANVKQFKPVAHFRLTHCIQGVLDCLHVHTGFVSQVLQSLAAR